MGLKKQPLLLRYFTRIPYQFSEILHAKMIYSLVIEIRGHDETD